MVEIINVTDEKNDAGKSEVLAKKMSSRSINSKDDDDVTFNFFYDLVKKLILKRNDVGDVCTLSSWLKALEQKNNSSIRNAYIKLMVLALQSAEPMCPFKDPPPETIDPLESNVRDMARRFAKGEGTATCAERSKEAAKPKHPSISTAVSRDKCRYAAYQVIPNLGVQCYYAYSDDHMYNWNMPPHISVPKGGPHARDIDWERATAGVNPQSKTPAATEEIVDADKSSGMKKDDKMATTSSTGSTKSAQTKNNEKASENKGSDKCNVMYIDQQNRNVTEEFGWNDASLLTGKMILGAENMISDCKIPSQLKTQEEIDEEVVSCHDKLYPGDFRIIVGPAVIEGIVIPEKKYVIADTVDKKMPQFVENAAKKTLPDGAPPQVRQKAGEETARAGSESAAQGEDRLGGAVAVNSRSVTDDFEQQKHRISKLSVDLQAAMQAASNGGAPGARCKKKRVAERAVDVGPCRPLKIGKNGGEQPPPTGDDDDAQRPTNDGRSLFERASVEMHRRLNAVSELFCDESKVSTSKKS